MLLYKVYITYEVTGHILVAAESVEEAEAKADKSLEASGWKSTAVINPEWVEGTEIVLHDSAEAFATMLT